uniref:Uncharacterized protein n=1 Tax=Anopheles dirus TaxID=7168 RepID=A0A182NWH8_9DIPT
MHAVVPGYERARPWKTVTSVFLPPETHPPILPPLQTVPRTHRRGRWGGGGDTFRHLTFNTR